MNKRDIHDIRNVQNIHQPGDGLISLLEASQISGYTQHHLGLLCRQKKLKAERVGRQWFTKKIWVTEYLKELENSYKENNNNHYTAGAEKVSINVFKKSEKRKRLEEKFLKPELAEEKFEAVETIETEEIKIPETVEAKEETDSEIFYPEEFSHLEDELFKNKFSFPRIRIPRPRVSVPKFIYRKNFLKVAGVISSAAVFFYVAYANAAFMASALKKVGDGLEQAYEQTADDLQVVPVFLSTTVVESAGKLVEIYGGVEDVFSRAINSFASDFKFAANSLVDNVADIGDGLGDGFNVFASMPSKFLSLVEIPKIPNLKIPTVSLPDFRMPRFALPRFGLADIKIPSFKNFALSDFSYPDFSVYSDVLGTYIFSAKETAVVGLQIPKTAHSVSKFVLDESAEITARAGYVLGSAVSDFTQNISDTAKNISSNMLSNTSRSFGNIFAAADVAADAANNQLAFLSGIAGNFVLKTKNNFTSFVGDVKNIVSDVKESYSLFPKNVADIARDWVLGDKEKESTAVTVSSENPPPQKGVAVSSGATNVVNVTRGTSAPSSLFSDVQNLKAELAVLKRSGLNIGQNGSEQRIIERVLSQLTEADVNAKLQNLNSDILAQVNAVKQELTQEILKRTRDNFSAIALTQRITQLPSPSISTPTISSPTVSGIADMETLHVSQNGSVSKNLNVGATLTVDGNLAVAGSQTFTGGSTFTATTTMNGDVVLGNATSSDTVFVNARFASSLAPNTDNLLDIGDSTNWLQWRTGLFGTSIGIAGTATSTGIQLTANGAYLIDSNGALSLNTTNNRQVIFGTGNIGVGTSTPYSRLSVWGNGTGATPLFELTNSASTTLASVLNNGTVYMKGNVGIGTTSPFTALGVVGTSTLQDIIPGSNLTYNLGTSALRYNAGWFGSLNIGTSTWSVLNSADGRLSFFDQASGAGNERLTILTTGNVGIGTSSPLAKLSVAGSGFFNENLTAANITATGTLAATGNVNFDAHTTLGNATTSDVTYFNSRIATHLVPNADNISDIGDSTNWLRWRSGLFGTSIGIAGTATSTGTSLTSSGAYLINSSSTLSINTTGNQPIIFGSGNVILPYASSTALTVSGLASTTNLYVSGNQYLSPMTAGSVFFSGANGLVSQDNPNLYWDDSLNRLGLGTTTPNWNLQIAGTRPSLALSDTSAAANSKHWLFSSMGGNLYIGTSTDAYATSTPAALTILNNGNFGLGTSSPSQKLSTDGLMYIGGTTGTSTITANLLVSGNLAVSGAQIFTGDQTLSGNLTVNGNTTLGNESGDTLTFNASTLAIANNLNIDSDTLFIDASTNRVGIGTTSPYAKLSVAGRGVFDQDIRFDYFTATSTTATSTLAGGLAIKTTGLVYDWQTNNVGIGTASPAYKLDVNGTLRAVDNVFFDSNTTLGNATTSDVTYFNSRIATHLVPNADNISDIGDSTNWLRWRSGLFGTSLGIGGTATSTGTSLTSSGAYLINSSSTLSINTTGNQPIIFGSGNVILPFASSTAITATTASTTDLIVSAGVTFQNLFGVLSSNGTSGVSARALTGTANQITVSNGDGTGGNPTFSLPSLLSLTNASTSQLSVFNKAYFGGTATSTFDSAGALTLITPLLVGSGGTGQTSFTSSQLLYGAGSGALQSVATSSLSLGLGLTGSNLGYLVGGSSPSLTIATSSLYTGTTGQFPYFSGTNILSATSSISDIYLDNNLTLAGGTISGTSNTMSLGSDATGDVYYRNSSGYLARLALGAGGYVLASSGGLPAWVASTTIPLAGDVGGTLSATAIGANKVTLGMLATLAANSVIGNITGSAATPTAIATSSLFTWTGTGDVVRATSPTLITPALGTPSALTLTNATGLLPAGMNLTKGNFLVGNDAGIAQATSTMFISSTGNVGIGTTSPSNLLSVYSSSAATMGFSGGGTKDVWSMGYDVTNNRFAIASSSSITSNVRMVIDGTGNVGIGTTNPKGVLTISAPDDSVNSALSIRQSNGISYGFDLALDQGVNGDMYLDRINNDVHANVMSFSRTTGKVGIGTTSPSNLLSVYSSSAATMGFSGGGTKDVWSMGYDVTNNRFAIASSSSITSNVRMVIDGTGNVGIGTTGPGALLHLNGANVAYRGQLSIQSTDYAQITFYEGATTQTNQGAQIYWDVALDDFVFQNSKGGDILLNASSGNVGIGTTTPASLLNIASTLPRFYLSDTDFATNGHWFMENNAGVFSLGTTSSALAVSNTRALSITNNGNVGIGTTTPSNLLSVYSSSAATMGFSGGGTKDVWSMGYDVTNNRFAIASSSSITSNVKMVINNNGNVGIGTTAPANKLHVYGSSPVRVIADTTGQYAVFNLYESGTERGAFYIDTTANTTILEASGGHDLTFNVPSIANAMVIKQTSGNVGIGTTTPAGLLNIASTLPRFYLSDTDFASNGHWFMENDAGVFSLGTTSSALAVSDTRALSITNTGNVGIGTTTPGAKLNMLDGNFILSDSDVAHGMTTVAPTNAYGLLKVLGDVDGGLIVNGISDGDVQGLGLYGTSGVASPATPVVQIRANKANGTGVQNLAAGEMVLRVDNGTSEGLMTILGSGNVGIGTTTPGALLNVYGGTGHDVTTGLFDSGGRRLRIAEQDNGSGGFYIQVQNSNTNETGMDNASLRTLSLNPGDGNVGIGTTTPNSILSLYQASADTGLSFGNSNATMWTMGTDISDGSKFKISSSSALGTNDRLTIDTNGNVGIGTTGPLSKLDVNGNITLSASAAANYIYTNPAQSHYILDNATNGQFVVQQGTNSTIFRADGTYYFQPSSGASNRATLDSSGNLWTNGTLTVAGTGNSSIAGNVGIGTTGPTRKLHIDGADDDGIRFTSTGGEYPHGITNYFASGGFPEQNNMKFNLFNGAEVTVMTLLGTGNVGIGTTTPQSLLHVNNPTVGGYARLQITTDSSGSGATDGLILVTNNDLSAALWNYENGLIQFGTNNTEKMRLSAAGGLSLGNSYVATDPGAGSMIISGNVGIGTTTPNQKLDVYSTASPYIQVSTVTGQSAGLKLVSAGNTWAIAQEDDFHSGNLLFNYGGTNYATNAMEISTTGNVGIGTTGPGAKLEVAGNLMFSKEVARVISVADSTTASTAGAALTIQGAAGAATAAGGAINITAGAPGGNDVGGAIGISAGGGWMGGAVNLTAGNGTILGGALNITGGSVGSGYSGGTVTVKSANGTAAGSVSGTVYLVTGNAVGNDTGTGPLYIASGTAGPAGGGNSGLISIVTGAGGSGSGNSGNLTLGTGAKGISGTAGSLIFQTNNTEYVRITNDGNVGIGTTSPVATLGVNGLMYIGGAGTSTIQNNLYVQGTLRATNSYVGDLVFGNEFRITEPSADALAFLNPAGKNIFEINSNGGMRLGSTATSSLADFQIMGHCVTGDTLLPIRRRRKAKNKRKTGDLDEYDYFLLPIKDVLPGDEVLSLNEAENIFEYRRINALLDMGAQEVFELTTASGRVIRTTSEHPYLVKL